MIDKELHAKVDNLTQIVGSIVDCLKGYGKNGSDGVLNRLKNVEIKLESKSQPNIPLYALLLSSIPTGLTVLGVIIGIITKLGGLW